MRPASEPMRLARPLVISLRRYPSLHEQLAGLGLWLDTSQQTPAESVAAILSQQDRATLPAPA